MKKTISALFIIISTTSFAGGLSQPLGFNSTTVLPEGIRNIRYKGVMTGATEEYDENGQVVAVGNAFNRSVTWGDIVNGLDDPYDQGQFEAVLKDKGYSLSDYAGDTTGVVNVGVQAHVPVFAFGVTKDATIAIAVPVYQSNIQVDTSAMAGDDMEAFANALVSDGQGDKAVELEQKFLGAVNSKLDKYGYEPLKDEQNSDLGDIKVISKYLLTKSAKFAMALQQEVVLPTGRPQDVNKLVDVPTGDGQTDIGASIVSEYYFGEKFFIVNNIGYLAQLPDTLAMRVPEEQDSTLTPDVDDTVRRNLGDQMTLGLAAVFQATKGLSISTGYTLQYKEADTFEGTKYEAERYGWMSQRTEQNMQTAQLGMEYSTIPAYRSGSFPVPLKTNFSVSTVVTGKNVKKDPLLSLELMAFF